ncbi:MAG: lipoate--protein ligase family protein [Waddliaceae bacterium]
MIIHLIRLKNYPIFKQLQLEEALLRADTRNFCLINEGSEEAIVLGISGKPERESHLPMIRRFSGGGTVVVDQHTHFVTFICNQRCAKISQRPNDIMCFMKKRLAPLFSHLPFDLKENDFVIGNRKFAGNAQYLIKERWLHHTTMLWDYKLENMRLLTLPEKRPEYRLDRAHDEFLCKLKEYFPDRTLFDRSLTDTLLTGFEVKEIALDTVLPVLNRPHRKALRLL